MKLWLVGLVCCALPVFGFAIQCYCCTHSTYPEHNLHGILPDIDCKMSSDKYLIECTENTIQQAIDSDDFRHKRQNQNAKNATLPLASENHRREFSCRIFQLTGGPYYTLQRGCDYYESDYCDEETYADGVTERECTCNTDGCNGEGNIFFPHTAALLVTVAVVFSNCDY